MSRGRPSIILLGALIVLAGSASGCGAGEPAVLRFDGLYRAGPNTSAGLKFWKYLRFYGDGTVLSASSTGEPAEVAAWFTRPYECSGTWTRDDDEIRFACQGPHGAVDYAGEVVENGLELEFHSHINDARGETAYGFVALEEPATRP